MQGQKIALQVQDVGLEDVGHMCGGRVRVAGFCSLKGGDTALQVLRHTFGI